MLAFRWQEKKKKKGETKGLRRKLEAAFKITLHKTPVCYGVKEEGREKGGGGG